MVAGRKREDERRVGGSCIDSWQGQGDELLCVVGTAVTHEICLPGMSPRLAQYLSVTDPNSRTFQMNAIGKRADPPVTQNVPIPIKGACRHSGENQDVSGACGQRSSALSRHLLLQCMHLLRRPCGESPIYPFFPFFLIFRCSFHVLVHCRPVDSIHLKTIAMIRHPVQMVAFTLQYWHWRKCVTIYIYRQRFEYIDLFFPIVVAI